MKYFKKKSRSFYALLACALLLSTVTPDKYTHQARAELATVTILTASWGLGSLSTTVSWSSVGATLLCALGLWGLSQNQNNTEAIVSCLNPPKPTVAGRVEQEAFLSIGTDTQIAAPLIEHTLQLMDSVAPLITDVSHAHIDLSLDSKFASDSFKKNPAHQFTRPKEMSSTTPFAIAFMAGLTLRGLKNGCKAIQSIADKTVKQTASPPVDDHIHDIEMIPQGFVKEIPRCFGIHQPLTADPLWATLSLKEKIYVSKSPIQKAVWNTHLALRQQAFGQIVDTLDLTKKQVTHSVKKIIYEALSRGGIFFSPLDRPDILASAIRAVGITTKERKRIFSLLFAKNGVLTCISGAPQLKKLKVSSNIFDPKHGNLLIGINQLGQLLKTTHCDVLSSEITFLTSLLKKTLKGVPHQDFETLESMFMRSCNALIKNECRVILQLPDPTRQQFSDNFNSYRLLCQHKLNKTINECLVIIDGLVLTPELQQRVEASLDYLVKGAHYAKRLMNEGSYEHARSYMDARAEYVTKDLKAIIKSVDGQYTVGEQEFFECCNAAIVAELQEIITKNPEHVARKILEEIIEKPFLLKGRIKNKQKKQKKQSSSENSKSKNKNKEKEPVEHHPVWKDRVPEDYETILNDPKFKRTPYINQGARVFEYNKRLYCRDNFHKGKGAHLEVFNKRGIHLGKANPLTGEIYPSTAVPSRRLPL